MKLRDYKNRSANLLRLAPWADLEAIRAEFAKRLEENIELSPYLYSAQSKKLAKSFIAGERNIMRSCVAFRDVLGATLRALYEKESMYDRHFYSASIELERYFFCSDEYLGIGSS